MPRIIFIRPAETDHCLRRAMLGRHDADLNENGRIQARVLAEVLNQWPVSFLGVSPLKRAIATALPIEDLQDISIHPVAGFYGTDLGDWENREITSILACDQGRYESWLADPDFRAPGGESTREVYARAYPELVNIVNHAHPGETIALVLQEGVMQALCCAVMDLPLAAASRFYLDHASFGIFERRAPGASYRMVAWNRNEHISESGPTALEWEEELPGV